MKLDSSKIEFSRPDIKREVKLPKKLTSELAEFVGIMLGDGHTNIDQGVYSNGKKYTKYPINIHGHYIDDFDYFQNVILPLFKNLFNLNLKASKEGNKNAIIGRKASKGIVHYLHKILSIPLGNKSKGIVIPSIILKSNTSILFSFIRGLFDTDGTITFQKKDKNKVHKYPIIKISLKDKNIIKQLSSIFNKYNLNHCVLYNLKKRLNNKIFFGNYISISGKKNLKKWMDLIGFNNPKHLTKYQIWKKFGFCPPYTNIIERRKILKGEINPYSYY